MDYSARDMNEGDLSRVLAGVEVWNAWRAKREREYPQPFCICDLRGADLRDRDLRQADFRYGALVNVDFRGANLSGARFHGSSLNHSDFSQADIRGADFTGTSLESVSFARAIIDDADLSAAKVGATVFAGLNLRAVRGLSEVQHLGPSTIGVDTIALSQGEIPEPFLKGCGVPEEFIRFSRSLVQRPIQFESCFISHSSSDQAFVNKLYGNLQDRGVRVWLATHDLPMGAKIRDGLDTAIHLHDRLIIVLSVNSIDSSWVEKEVETAFDRERRERRQVLFPIRIDSSPMSSAKAWVADIRRQLNIGDFSQWQNQSVYLQSLDRLLAALSTRPTSSASPSARAADFGS